MPHSDNLPFLLTIGFFCTFFISHCWSLLRCYDKKPVSRDLLHAMDIKEYASVHKGIIVKFQNKVIWLETLKPSKHSALGRFCSKIARRARKDIFFYILRRQGRKANFCRHTTHITPPLFLASCLPLLHREIATFHGLYVCLSVCLSTVSRRHGVRSTQHCK